MPVSALACRRPAIRISGPAPGLCRADIVVSGLPQRDDHELIVEVLAEMLEERLEELALDAAT